MTEESLTNESNIYNCDDGDLGKTLFKLFGEGNDEVVIQHPVDGEKVVTRKEYYAHLAHMEKIKNLSPADRLVEARRVRNIKNQKQMRLRKAMVTAPVHTVDFETDDSEKFGYDVDGVKLDIEGLIFIGVKDYPKGGIDIIPDEVGAFIDTELERLPIRLVAA